MELRNQAQPHSIGQVSASVTQILVAVLMPQVLQQSSIALEISLTQPSYHFIQSVLQAMIAPAQRVPCLASTE